MGSKSPYELIIEMYDAENKRAALLSDAKYEIQSWLTIREVFNFRHFSLQKNYHSGLKPVAIYGRSHDWSLLTETSDSTDYISYISLSFTRNSDINTLVANVRLEYSDGTEIYLDIPAENLKSYDSFLAWYKNQKQNYDDNCKIIKEAVKKRESAKTSAEFVEWRNKGKLYEKQGLVVIEDGWNVL